MTAVKGGGGGVQGVMAYEGLNCALCLGAQIMSLARINETGKHDVNGSDWGGYCRDGWGTVARWRSVDTVILGVCGISWEWEEYQYVYNTEVLFLCK